MVLMEKHRSLAKDLGGGMDALRIESKRKEPYSRISLLSGDVDAYRAMVGAFDSLKVSRARTWTMLSPTPTRID